MKPVRVAYAGLAGNTARRPDARPVDLFHSAADSDEPAFKRLRLDAAVPDWLRGRDFHQELFNLR